MYGQSYPPKWGRLDQLPAIAKQLQETTITYVATNHVETDHANLITIPEQDHKEFAESASRIVHEGEFDIIHAQGFFGYLAALKAKETSGKPLIVHATETSTDRNNGLKNDEDFALESQIFNEADCIIANEQVKNKIIQDYGIDASKISSPDRLLETYRRAKNSHIIAGKQEIPLKTESTDVAEETATVAHIETTSEWMRWGIVDLMIGIGIGFIIALFFLTIR